MKLIVILLLIIVGTSAERFKILPRPHKWPPTKPYKVLGDNTTAFVSYSIFRHPLYPKPFSVFFNGLLMSMFCSSQTLPEWNYRVYAADDIPISDLEQIENIGYEVVRVTFEPEHWMDGMTWRFLIHDDPQVDIYMVRDLDSRITSRDAAIIETFVHMEHAILSIHDHAQHSVPMLGGMWGGKRSLVDGMLIKPMLFLLSQYTQNRQMNTKGMDQTFLASVVWPRVKKNGVVYTNPNQHPRHCYGGLLCLRIPEHFSLPVLLSPNKSSDFIGRPCAENETYNCSTPNRCERIFINAAQ